MSRRTSVEAHAELLDIALCVEPDGPGGVTMLVAVVDLVLARVTFRVVVGGKTVVVTPYLGVAVGAYNAILEDGS